jgi:hypothetical protein
MPKRSISLWAEGICGERSITAGAIPNFIWEESIYGITKFTKLTEFPKGGGFRAEDCREEKREGGGNELRGQRRSQTSAEGPQLGIVGKDEDERWPR